VRTAGVWCLITGVAIEMDIPGVEGLREAVSALRRWQHDDAPMQLHPGDLGWFWRFGVEATAAAVRTWSRGGKIVAVGLLDGPQLLRLTVAPQAQRDREVAQQLVADVSRPRRGVLPAGRAAVETPNGALVQQLLSQAGWTADEGWTPLRRDLTEPVQDPAVRVDVIGLEQAPAYSAVLRSAFGTAKFTDERFNSMAGGLPYVDARCLVAYDAVGEAVGQATVWSAGAGRPGLLEPLGVHAEHRGRGYGKAIAVAAAAVLQAMGASSAMVCTPTANTGAVATYESAGFRRLPQRRDRCQAA
jgi:ribosomal protein S18 acetylase RimI-like enzyme